MGIGISIAGEKAMQCCRQWRGCFENKQEVACRRGRENWRRKEEGERRGRARKMDKRRLWKEGGGIGRSYLLILNAV